MKDKPKQITVPRTLVSNFDELLPATAALERKSATLEQVRVEMASHYYAAKRGDITIHELKGYLYALTQIAKLIELDRLEERLNDLDTMARAVVPTH